MRARTACISMWKGLQEGLEPLKKSEEDRLKRVYDRIDKNADGYGDSEAAELRARREQQPLAAAAGRSALRFAGTRHVRFRTNPDHC